MNEYPWCIDAKNIPLGFLEDSAEAYYAEFETVHSQIDEDEWKQIVEPMNLTENGLEEYETKPDLLTWFQLSEPDCWGEQRAYLQNYDVVPEMEQIVEILLIKLQGDALAATDDQKEFKTEPQTTTIRQLQRGDWVNFPIDDIVIGLNVIFENTSASAREAFNECLNLTNNIRTKLNNITCPPAVPYFKDEYQKALLKLAQPEIDRQIAEHEAAHEQYKAAKSLDRGSGGGAADAAESLVGITQQIEDLRREAIKRIEEAIKDNVEKEFEESFADNIAYAQQCFLLTFMKEAIEAKRARDSTKIEGFELTRGQADLPYNTLPFNSPIRMVGEPFGFINKLTVDPSQSAFFDIDNKTLSSLIPHIRFFKVQAGADGKDVETEIEFDANGYDSIFNGPTPTKNAFRRQRGHGVGMRSFNFSYDGTDPFSAKKMIAAKLSIYASTFDELLRVRQDPNKLPYQYAELALKTGGVSGEKKETLSETERKNLDKLNFRLKATIGWTADNSVFKKLPAGSPLKKAIYNSYITIYLTPTIHNFSFDETGAVTFDIEYLAYIEDAFSQSSFNIFAGLNREKQAREIVYQYFEEIGCDVDASEDFKKFRKADERLISGINARAFGQIIDRLQVLDRIYYINLDANDTEKLARDPTDPSVKFPEILTDAQITDEQNFNKAIQQAAKLSTDEGVDEDAALLSIMAVSAENNTVPFFYLSDLIKVVMQLIESELLVSSEQPREGDYYKKIFDLAEIDPFDEKQIGKISIDKKIKNKNSLEQFRKMRVILGPMEMFNPLKSDGTILCSIGDLPISLSYFFEFMSDRVLAKEILSYPFSKFIKDIINDLIGNFLNSDSCTRVDNSQKIKLNSTTVCAYNKNPFGSVKSNNNQCIDDITYNIKLGRKKAVGQPLLMLSGQRDTNKDMLTIDRMMSYFIFTVGRKSPVSNYLGNKAMDEKVGIFHYLLGKDNGFIKNISLEKTTATGLKEVRFEQEGYNGLEQLREVYNAKIDTFLNVQSFPGVYVYVEPAGFAPNTLTDLTRYGIGGYCMVVKTEHTISPGTADTTLHTVWVASKEGNSTKNQGDSSTKKRDQSVAEGTEAIKKCLLGPHDIGLIVTRRGRYSGLTDEEAGDLGSRAVEAGAYLV